MDQETSHERLQDEVIPAEERSKPDPAVSPGLELEIAKEKASDLEAQQSGQISRLYDLGPGKWSVGTLEGARQLKTQQK